MNPDFLINREAKLVDISRLLVNLNISEYDYYGRYIAKVNSEAFKHHKRKAKLILVTAINPTPSGEGKTTTTIGLSDALCKLGNKSIVCLREPALGPVFGIKGGATGGGYSQVAPMDKINLHFTGDFAAIASAHNLLAAMIDNHIFQGNELDINEVTWRRVIDMNDRALRDKFDIVVASEVMATLCLVNNIDELKERLGNIVIGYTSDKREVTARDLKVHGAMTALLVDAIKPNLVQTLENNPAFIHGGPFANIAHGCNSVIATDLALKLGDWVVTEAGFASELGAEKFLDIKCRKAQLVPDVAVVVATIRALKHHGKGSLEVGFENLRAHVNNLKNNFGLPVVVAVNQFADDRLDDLTWLIKASREVADGAAISGHWLDGSEGASTLAQTVIDVTTKPRNSFKMVYSNQDSLMIKIEKVVKNVYGCKQVVFPLEVQQKLLVEFKKYEHFPICISKTHKTIAPVEGESSVWIDTVELRAGAEFIVVKIGNIITLPGLPVSPSAIKVDVVDGEIVGLN